MHILGMAKSNLTLKPGQAIRLELDFFKLAFAVAAFKANKEEAIGYLQVLSPGSETRAKFWCEKYQTNGAIVVLCEEPSDEDKKLLINEKKSNATGIVPQSTQTIGAVNPSSGNFGKDLGEAALAKRILQLHPTVMRISESDKHLFPHGINWDFYGKAKTP